MTMPNMREHVPGHRFVALALALLAPVTQTAGSPSSLHRTGTTTLRAIHTTPG